MSATSAPTPRNGLRRDLLVRLMLPLLAIVAATGVLGVMTAQRLVDQVFDRWLLDSLHALAAQVRSGDGPASVDLSPAAIALLTFDEDDETFFGVTQDAQVLAGRAGLPDDGARTRQYRNGRAFDGVVDGRPARVAALELCPTCATPVQVRVAETVVKRTQARDDILAMLLPIILLLGSAAITIVYALQRTIVPLERIASGWTEQSHLSLRPVGTDGVPRELLPFAHALNGLLERLRAMLARERQFATTAAHQLRTPLAGLQLGLARAAEAPTVESARSVIVGLNASTQRTARLIQQLLSLGRLDPEVRGELAFAPIDLVKLARDVGTTYLDAATRRRIDLELIEPAAPVVATVHADLIGEALGNLLDNALRYTPEGGRVEIDFEARPPSLRVSDSGPGIDDDLKGAVFERFVRGRRDVGEGSGLGLSIVRDIALLHGATLELDRGALGGAAVTLRFAERTLPRAAPDADGAAAGSR